MIVMEIRIIFPSKVIRYISKHSTNMMISPLVVENPEEEHCYRCQICLKHFIMSRSFVYTHRKIIIIYHT